MELNSFAIIPDGNRRYALANNMALTQAYLLGTKKAWEAFEWISEYPSIQSVTFYTLSKENLTRTKEELGILFKIFEKELSKAISRNHLLGNSIKVKFIGRKDFFSEKIQKRMNELENETIDNSGKTLALAIGYNGQTEIIDAAKKIAEQVKEGLIEPEKITPELFKKNLYSELSFPDLIMRTSGTQRLSGFLTYQSAYSELVFLNKYWPEVTKQDIDKVINEFNSRERRFGK
ncbi:MAG: di-trans,poly-cis-decaprenylcistransferase [Candidatus Diapherotrites archaeon]|nr:di-trans,poly-cis-decaprenylcistransferase [Candidatus Diapherotrites archaeon]